MSNKYKYVATYQNLKYKFGNDVDSLKKFTDKNGLEGTACLYCIQEDGSWSPIEH